MHILAALWLCITSLTLAPAPDDGEQGSNEVDCCGGLGETGVGNLVLLLGIGETGDLTTCEADREAREP